MAITNPIKNYWKFEQFKKTQNLKSKPNHKFRRCGNCTKQFVDADVVYSAYADDFGGGIILICEKCKNQLGLEYPKREEEE